MTTRSGCRLTALFCFLASAALPAGQAAAATLIGPYPFAPGDQFVFAYASTDSVQKGTGAPTVTTQSYTETTTIEPAVKYSFPPGSGSTVTAYPVETKASSTSSAGTYTRKIIEYRNFVADGKVTDYLLYGYSDVSDLVESKDVTLHESTVRTWETPFILDELPEKTGAGWAEPIARHQTIDNEYYTSTGDENVLQSKVVGKPDGSYTDDGLDYDVPYDIAQKSGGTGTLLRGPSGSQEEWSFALPKSSSKGEIVPVTITYEGKTGMNSVPDWYPGGGAPADPLTTEGLTDKGTATVPKGCGHYAGSKAQLLESTYSQLAPAAGFTLVETDTYYIVPKIGRACYEVNYTRTTYDAKVKGDVTEVEIFSSTLGLEKETLK
jgi:hypothetical protein